MSDSYYRDPYGYSASPGRWNPAGAEMIYATGSASLALLEYLCIRGLRVGGREWHMIVFEITDNTLVGTLDARDLFSGWSALPHGKATQDFGKAWLDEKEYPFLKVPSSRLDITLYPGEFNLLINPDFPGITKLLKVVDNKSFRYLLNS